MLFKPELAQLILTGLKTQTRRLVQPSDHPFRDAESGAILWITRLTKRGWQMCYGRADSRGIDYAVCPGRGKRQVGRIRIIQIRLERLQDISEEDALAEGLRTVSTADGTTTMYYLLNRTAALSICPFEALAIAWDSLNRKRGERWEDNPLVWALTFEVAK